MRLLFLGCGVCISRVLCLVLDLHALHLRQLLRTLRCLQQSCEDFCPLERSEISSFSNTDSELSVISFLHSNNSNHWHLLLLSCSNQLGQSSS